MDLEALQRTYAPILHFSAGEQFYPMAVEDFLSYAALHTADRAEPLITEGRVRPEDLLRATSRGDTFLRSVARGPLWGRDVAATWSRETLSLVSRWANASPLTWSDDVARAVYAWFSPKTAAATRLFWWNSLLLQRDPGEGRAALPRFRLPGETHASAVERYQEFSGGRPPLTYYYRATQRDGYLNLQYWFFYAFNDWANAFDGFNDHEGDWECVQLFFRLQGVRPSETPSHICYLGHNSRLTKPWDHPEVQRSGNHPHVYVAAGSHASYPEPKTYPIMTLYNLIDRATGDAITVDQDDWRRRIDLDSVPWLTGYTGSWGTRYWLSLGALRELLKVLGVESGREVLLPGVSAPRCPRYSDEGQERPAWADGPRFAGLLES